MGRRTEALQRADTELLSERGRRTPAYDVLSQKREKGQYPVLFDYKERSPLTHDARVCAVEFEQRKEDV